MSDGFYASDGLVPTPLASLAGDTYQPAQDQRRKIPHRHSSAVETALCNEQQDSTPLSEHEVDRLA